MTTKFDASLLDRDFVVVGTANAAARVVKAFEQSQRHFYVVGDHLSPGEQGLLLDRPRLIKDLVDDSGLRKAQRADWEQVLKNRPALLTAFIAGHVLDVFDKIEPDDNMRVAVDAVTGGQVTMHVANYLADWRRLGDLRANVVEVAKIAGTPQSHGTIAVEKGYVVGVLGPSEIRFGAPGAGLGMVIGREAAFGPRKGKSGSAAAGIGTAKDTSSAKAAAARAPAAKAGAEEVEAAERFVAYPRLDAPKQLARSAEFAIAVGFSDQPDPDADEQQEIDIPDAVASDRFVVMVTAQGATIVEPSDVRLPPQMLARHVFKARVDPGAKLVELRAQYFYRARPVGHIVKSIPVQGASAKRRRPRKNVRARFSPQLSDYHDIDAIDVALLVQKRDNEQVSWKALVTRDETIHGPFYVSLPDRGEFAKKLAGLRKVHGDSGRGALEALAVTGQRIAECIPPDILEEVLLPAIKDGTPTVLLMTDEPFVPWELARIGPPLLEKPAFLGELACIGRWWTGRSLGGPPSNRDILAISAVAASSYKAATFRDTLKHAKEEQAWLTKTYPPHVREVEAVRAEIDPWLDTDPRLPGHLAHIALHGYSDTGADDQGLILGDGHVLTPDRLAGEFYAGYTPRFEMVFLNACQVGTAGERLGRIAGFPGSVLAGGASAFIGPLWEVQDEVAQVVAQRFYEQVLTGNVQVGEALRSLRSAPELSGSITPWAYLYYGHPSLKLTRRTPAST
jgi:CHAT domain-containing protein